MHSITRLVAVVAGLVLMLHVTPSWSQPVCVAPGCNPTLGDLYGNTAGGSGALVNVDLTMDPVHANTAFGGSALHFNTTGEYNTATGTLALSFNTTGRFNTASGAYALSNNTTGTANTASGFNALNSNTTGSMNTASGGQALQFNTIGDLNTATGLSALYSNTTGSLNTASGTTALASNTGGNYNTAMGSNALTSNDIGSRNTATGSQALESNSTGNNNTAIGAKALKKSLGTKNIAIGFQAGVSLITGNNNIYIGNQGAGDEFQTIRIGAEQTQTFIAGINVAGVSGTAVVVDANGQLGITLSSARYKQDIAPMGTNSEGVLRLRPVTFAYKDDSKGVTHYGLVAEEVAAVYPELVTHTTTGEVQTVKYQELIPMLLNELQRQRQDFQQALQRQQQELAEMSVLRKEMAELRALVGQGRETASLAR